MRPGVKAIVLAASATPEEVIASLRLHAFACFTAPFPMGEVAEMMRRAVQNPDWKDGLQVVSARPDWLSLRVDCRRLAADRLVRFLSELANDLPDVTRDDLLAAFREIALNAMEHGAGFAPDQVIEVTAVRTKRAIVYYVRDPGPGFSPEDLPHAAVNNPPDDPLAHTEKRAELGLRPGGFGLLIAQPRRRRVPAQREGERGAADQAHSLAGARGVLKPPESPSSRSVPLFVPSATASARPRPAGLRMRAARPRSPVVSQPRTAPRPRTGPAARARRCRRGRVMRPISVPVATLCIFSTAGCQTPVAGARDHLRAVDPQRPLDPDRRCLEHPQLRHHRERARLLRAHGRLVGRAPCRPTRP